jgi:hypothetical protein
MGDQRHQAVMLREQKKGLPIHQTRRQFADEPAVFVALRPAGTEQQQVELRRSAARCLWSEFLWLLQALPAFPPSFHKTIASEIYRVAVRMSSIR